MPEKRMFGWTNAAGHGIGNVRRVFQWDGTEVEEAAFCAFLDATRWPPPPGGPAYRHRVDRTVTPHRLVWDGQRWNGDGGYDTVPDHVDIPPGVQVWSVRAQSRPGTTTSVPGVHDVTGWWDCDAYGRPDTFAPLTSTGDTPGTVAELFSVAVTVPLPTGRINGGDHRDTTTPWPRVPATVPAVTGLTFVGPAQTLLQAVDVTTTPTADGVTVRVTARRAFNGFGADDRVTVVAAWVGSA